jgi:RHS repeat-associated protein
VNGAQINYTSNNLNQYISVDSANYSYDADGNQTRANDANYIYNSENRLVRMSRGDDTWEYEYDLLGNRSAVIHNGQVTSFLVDPLAGYGNVVGVYKSDGSLDAHYAYGNGLLAGFGPGGGWYYEADAIGSVRNYTDDSGNSLTGGITYDPFGGQLGGDARGLATSAQARYGFVGKLGVEQDGSGLIYMRARQYDPVIGRFTSADPLGVNGGSFNINSYANNNPVVFVDANGLRCQKDINADISFWQNVKAIANLTLAADILLAALAVAAGQVWTAPYFAALIFADQAAVITAERRIESLQMEKADPEPCPPCLAPGTLIRTPSGNRLVEELQIGDLVLTPDGPLPLKFLGISTRHVNNLKASGRMPIRIQSGVFGHNLPSADIYCTPSHAFTLGDCLVEAQALLNGQSIYQLEELSEYDQRHKCEQHSPLAEHKETDSFTYYSLEFDQHVLVWANDLLTESYLPTYRDGEPTRVAWNNYYNYINLYGSSETMDELPIPRIPFSRQIPLRIREQFGLISSNGPSSAGISSSSPSSSGASCEDLCLTL